jgi:SAM-dependent methyltransferase
MNDEKSYAEKVTRELSEYENRETVHDLPQIFHYWANKFLAPQLRSLGFDSFDDFFAFHIGGRCGKSGENCEIVSLGSGNCDFEINLASELRRRGYERFHFHCLELNEAMLARGEKAAAAAGLANRFSFQQCDLNAWQPAAPFDVALANHSLHHIVALEWVFDGVVAGLRDGGVFLVNDMIGRNGHMRWPEALRVVEELWQKLPRSYKFHHLFRQTQDEFVNWDCSTESFEGIRAQDILPELLQRFEFDSFLGFGNVIDIFIDRGFGPNFDPEKEWDRAFIDCVHARDQELLERGAIKPTHIFAALLRRGAEPKCYKNLSPAFCVRWPQDSETRPEAAPIIVASFGVADAPQSPPGS